MDDADIKTILAFLFKREGKNVLSSSELYLTLSISLKWFPPSEAKALIDEAIQKKLLVKEEEKDLLKPNFQYKKISVPPDFHPEESKVKDKKHEKKLLEKLIQQISIKTDEEKHQIYEKCLSISEEKGLTPEVAALFLGKEKDVDLDVFLDEAEKKILK